MENTVKLIRDVRIANNTDLKTIARIEHNLNGKLRYYDLLDYFKLVDNHIYVFTMNYMVYGYVMFREDDDNNIWIDRIMVDEDYRMQKIGTTLIAAIRFYAHTIGKPRIIFDVPDTELSVQLFLKSMKFNATKIIGDKYRMEYWQSLKPYSTP